MKPQCIPKTLLANLTKIPTDCPVILMLRHSVRPDPLPPGEAGNQISITEVGKQLACNLGMVMGERLAALHVSPLLRCIQTAEAIKTGAQAKALMIAKDKLLGDPGIYVTDAKAAGPYWTSDKYHSTMRYLADGKALPSPAGATPASDRPEGVTHEPYRQAHRLVQHMLHSTNTKRGVHCFISHDSLIAITINQILGREYDRREVPHYLEGFFLWETQTNGAQTASLLYRGLSSHGLRLLEADDVLDH
ncbi:MAG: hypothetical protein ACR2PW_08725 [Gammaproteobacteria bacterium]